MSVAVAIFFIVVALWVGAALGFLFAAMLAAGKRADTEPDELDWHNRTADWHEATKPRQRRSPGYGTRDRERLSS